MTSESDEAAARLTALADQLKAHTRDLKQEITPEWIASLEPWQQTVILRDLMALQAAAIEVKTQIEEQMGDG